MLQSVGSQSKPAITVLTSTHIKDIRSQEQLEALLAQHGSDAKLCPSSFKILQHRGINVPEKHALSDSERASILAQFEQEPVAGHS